jgi:hypothetical protein
MQHAKTRFPLVLLVLAFILASSLVFAENNGSGQNYRKGQGSRNANGYGYGPGPQMKRFTAKGVVTDKAVVKDHPEAFTLTVNLEKANRLLRDQIGSEVDFEVASKVKVKTEGTDPGVFDLALDDVDSGETVRILGKYDGTNFQVTQIVVFVED